MENRKIVKVEKSEFGKVKKLCFLENGWIENWKFVKVGKWKIVKLKIGKVEIYKSEKLESCKSGYVENWNFFGKMENWWFLENYKIRYLSK